MAPRWGIGEAGPDDGAGGSHRLADGRRVGEAGLAVGLVAEEARPFGARAGLRLPTQ